MKKLIILASLTVGLLLSIHFIKEAPLLLAATSVVCGFGILFTLFRN